MDIQIIDDPTPPIPSTALRERIVAEGTRRRARRRNLTAATVAVGITVLAIAVPMRLNRSVQVDMTQSPPATISAPRERPPVSLAGGWDVPLSRLDDTAGEVTFTVPLDALHTSDAPRTAELLTTRLGLLGQPGRAEVVERGLAVHFTDADARAAEIALRRALPRGAVQMAELDRTGTRPCTGSDPADPGVVHFDATAGCVVITGSVPAGEWIAGASVPDEQPGTDRRMVMTLTPAGRDEVWSWQSRCLSGSRGSVPPGTQAGEPAPKCTYQSVVVDGWVIENTGGGSLQNREATSIEINFPVQYGQLDLRQIAAYLTTGPLPGP